MTAILSDELIGKVYTGIVTTEALRRNQHRSHSSFETVDVLMFE